MKPGRLLLGLAVAGAIAAVSFSALATDALTFPLGAGSAVSGYKAGGYGWSFVPASNIVVTSVGYLDVPGFGGDPNVVITIWSGTNAQLASYTGITNPALTGGQIISTAIAPLALSRGQLYSITAYVAPLSSSSLEVAVFDNGNSVQYNPFILAPALSQYEGLQLNQNGTFSPLSSDASQNQQLLYLGPTFTYSIFSSQPVLHIAISGSQTVQLTWPTNAAGFALQRSAIVTGTYMAVTNVPAVAGTNYSTILSSTNAAGFFRLAKPN